MDDWVRFVRGGFDVYREYLNSPATMKRIGQVRGLEVLDLGCGEGYHSRMLARLGAGVTGVDATAGMIAYARAEERREPLGIRYLNLDCARMSGLRLGQFDLVVSFMALMDMEDYRGTVKEVARVLRRGGRFVFSVPHPCFDTVFRGGKMVSGWVRKGGRARRGKKLYFKIQDYFRTGLYSYVWALRGTTASFQNVSWHLTLSDYVNALADSGLVIRRLDEPRPLPAGSKKYPGLREVNRIPQSIVVEAVKPRSSMRNGL